jgi:hypothetical protein
MAPSRFVSALPLILMLLPAPGRAQVQTTISPALPNLNTDAAPAEDTAGGTYCRPPQQRLDSRFMGPKVCMTIKAWNELHATGMDIGPDGVTKIPIQNSLLHH